MAQIADSVILAGTSRPLRLNNLSVAQTGRPGPVDEHDLCSLDFWRHGDAHLRGPEIERLVHAGFLARRTDPAEGIVLSITDEGYEALKKLLEDPRDG